MSPDRKRFPWIHFKQRGFPVQPETVVTPIREIEFHIWGSERSPIARLAYCVAGKELYFSGLDFTSSTINHAEFAILTACRHARVGPNNLTAIIDINTHLGFRDLVPGDARISKLEVEFTSDKPGIRVVKALPLEIPDGHPVYEGAPLTGIPSEIRNMFEGYIGEWVPGTPNWSQRFFMQSFRTE